MRFDPAGPVVVLSPHLDDAVLSAWSVLRGPGEVVVVNVFAALPDSGAPTPWDAAAGATDAREHVQRRLDEDRAALALAGRDPVTLPFLDGQYRQADPPVSEMASALERQVPFASALHAPAAIRLHVDHVIARELGIALAMDAGIPLSLYADLPYAVHRGWPHWVTGARPDPFNRPEVEWELALASASITRDALSASVQRLDDDEAGAKLTAMRRYHTQFSLLNRGPIGMLEHPAVLPYEVSWTLARD